MTRRQKGQPNDAAWRLARSWGQTHCCYCRNLFTEQHPPTRDHIRTNHDSGDRDTSGIVLCCQPCNNARGAAPHDAYMEAVTAEWKHADREAHPYRRPKYRTVPGGGYEITTETKAQVRLRKAEARQRAAS